MGYIPSLLSLYLLELRAQGIYPRQEKGGQLALEERERKEHVVRELLEPEMHNDLFPAANSVPMSFSFLQTQEAQCFHTAAMDWTRHTFTIESHLRISSGPRPTITRLTLAK
jgi:hypothetical protein